MNAKHARQIVLVLVGLALLASLVLLFIVVRGLWSADEPTYEGKPVSVWFREHAYASNAVASAPQPVGTRFLPDGRMVLMQITRDGRVVTLPGPTNRAAQVLWLQQQMSLTRRSDPAWEALQALGSNAVPCLVRHLRSGALDQAYERAFTNLPAAIQKKLPNPWLKRWLRVRAIDTLASLKLGESGRAATPHLLELLKQRDPSLRRAVCDALRSLHVDHRSITRVQLQLGLQRKFTDVVEIASQMGWGGDDMARLLGEILRKSDPALRRDTMRLLEYSGPAAAPAQDNVILALKDSDKEVRYLAARSIEAIGTNSPQVIAVLRSALDDEHTIVRIVAHRALTNFAPELVPATDSGEPTR